MPRPSEAAQGLVRCRLRHVFATRAEKAQPSLAAAEAEAAPHEAHQLGTIVQVDSTEGIGFSSAELPQQCVIGDQ